MIDELDIHNQFKESLSRYLDFDPHLRRLKKVPFIFKSTLLTENPFHIPGIYQITGGRQIGKTTFLKQFIQYLLEKKKVRPENVLFITGEIIEDHNILRRIAESFCKNLTGHGHLFIDEVGYIKDWDRSIKYLADAGYFEDTSVILTGSDSKIIRTAMKRFAGRRGASDQVDFDFYPLSFMEFICLIRDELQPLCKDLAEVSLTDENEKFNIHLAEINDLLHNYLIHGGYLPAINEYYRSKTIPKSVLNTYVQWIRGDILKHNKTENYLFEIIKGIKATYNSQISWNSLSKYLSIEHHKTVSDYCQILESMHVLHIQEALLEHKLTGAPKKNRKIFFCDPFIDHALSIYLDPQLTIEKIFERMSNNEVASSYVEALCVDHCKRWLPTYYIKGPKGEVDLALVLENKFYPIEVKWTRQVRGVSLKQISTYKNGIVLTPERRGRAMNCLFVPLARFLIKASGRKLPIY
jgi:predicted AAA+ superfamily ATPase